MRRSLVSMVVLIAGLGYVGGPMIEACGAKFLVATQSSRLPRAQRTAKPAAILLYQHSTDAGVVEFMRQLQDTLTGVGHKVTLVTTVTALRDTADRQTFDVVMLQLDAARALRGDLAARSTGAVILPMKAYVTQAEAARVKEEFGHMLRLPTTDRQLFSVVRTASR